MTNEEKIVIAVVTAFLDTVKESGEQGVPLGPCYAAFNARGMSYDAFMGMIAALQRIGKIRVSNHCAIWCGNA